MNADMKVLQKNIYFPIKLFLSSLTFLLIVQCTLQDQFETYEPVGPVCHGECDCRNQNNALLLNCTNRGMTHVLAQWPPHPSHLIASFNWNNISELQQMPTTDAKTIALSFSHCGIQKLESALFINAIGIEFLDLSWNLLTGQEVTADKFRGRYNNMAFEPINLRQLDLSHNHIESLGHLTFEHTPKLTRLNLNHNPLRVLDPQTVHALSSVLPLQALQLANTSLSNIPNEVFSRLRKLQVVDLSWNKFKHVPEALVYLSASLVKLTLDGNPIEHLEDHDFMGLHKLKELRISDMNELQTIYHNTFAYLPDLQVLNCTNNRKLHRIHQHAFGINDNNPSLRELYLSDNNLETIYHDQVNWSSLSVLDLSGNRWLCNCELYHTLVEIYNVSEIITPAFQCSMPSSFEGTSLDDIDTLQSACYVTLVQYPLQNIFTKTALILSVVLLTLIACFVFWKVLIRYNSIRSINTMYPIMYVSAPTYEN